MRKHKCIRLQFWLLLLVPQTTVAYKKWKFISCNSPPRCPRPGLLPCLLACGPLSANLIYVAQDGSICHWLELGHGTYPLQGKVRALVFIVGAPVPYSISNPVEESEIRFWGGQVKSLPWHRERFLNLEMEMIHRSVAAWIGNDFTLPEYDGNNAPNFLFSCY